MAQAAGRGSKQPQLSNAGCAPQAKNLFSNTPQSILRPSLASSQYGVWLPETYGFQDQLGLVRDTKSKFDERNTVGRSFTLRTTVGDLAGAQRLRVQLVLELPHFLLLSAAPIRPLPSAHRRWVRCLTMSSKVVKPLERVAQDHPSRTLLACRMMPRAR